MNEKPLVAVSRCLLGENVRYDGETKFVPSLIEALRRHFNIIGVCPEVEAGLPVPRPPVKLVRRNHAIHAVGVNDAQYDVTQRLLRHATEFVVANRQRIAGFVLKARSPSCGFHTTPILPDERTGSGLFVQTLLALDIEAPIQDEIALADPGGLENFVGLVQYYATQNLE